MRNILVGKPGRRRPPGRPRRRWKDNIVRYLRKIGWKCVDYMHPAEERNKWPALVNTVMNLRVPWSDCWLPKKDSAPWSEFIYETNLFVESTITVSRAENR
jgi:hypothetical protein